MWDKIKGFFFASGWEVVTWVWIGLSINAVYHNLGNKNKQGMYLAIGSLAIAVIVMLFLLAKRHFWDTPTLKPRGKLTFKGAQATLRVDGPEDITISITNLGDLTVTHLWLDGFTTVQHKGFPGPLERQDTARTEYPDTIIPGATVSTVLRGGRDWTRKGVNGVLNGKYLLFHYSEGEYTDESGGVYPIRFCFKYEPGFPVMSICDKCYWPKDR